MKASFLNFFLSIFFSIFVINTSFSQYSLDEIRIVDGYETRLLGINDAGFICGYYTLFDEKGFVITPSGNIVKFDAPEGYTHTRVVAINNRESPVVVIKASNSTSLNSDASVFKAYYNSQNDDFGPWTEITGLGITNPNPTGINNSNQIIGWYGANPGDSQPRYLWLYFDSVATMPDNYSDPYYATRYTQGTAPKPTFAYGINDTGEICGYYYKINPAEYESFTFNIANKSFNVFSNVSNRLLKDINDVGFVIGGLKLSANNRSFMGTFNGNILSSIPVPIFSSGLSIQSEFTGVNNKEDITGNYQHPMTGEWVAFVYRKNTPELRLPGFDFEQHTWKMGNWWDQNIPPENVGVWSENYFGDFDYEYSDPYINQDIPVYDNIYWPPAEQFYYANSYSWKGFCTEIDDYKFSTLLVDFPGMIHLYRYVKKKIMFDKYIINVGPDVAELEGQPDVLYSQFGGYCYGFTYTALQKLYDSTRYQEWFGYTENPDAGLSDNTDFQAILSIERTNMKQLDVDVENMYQSANYDKVPLSLGMYRLKSDFQKSFDEINPSGISFEVLAQSETPDSLESDGYHAVLPYKIKTPLHLPFNYPVQQYDSLFVYDSNAPSDSSQHFLIKNDLAVYDNNHDSIYSSLYNISNAQGVAKLNFNEVRVKDLPEYGGHKEISLLKPSGEDDEISDYNDNNPYYTFGLVGSAKYTIKNNAGHSATLLNKVWTNDIEDLMAKIPYNAPPIPRGFQYDTTLSAHVVVSGYKENGFMNWTTSNNSWSMSITRPVADSTEIDYGMTKHKYWGYGTHDENPKNLTLQFAQADTAGTLAARFVLLDFIANQGDSLITYSPRNYEYAVIRIGGDPLTYNLKSFIWENNAIQIFETPVPIAGNTTHVFDPYFDGPNGHQLVIYVDNGNNGNYNDTLFLATTGLNELKNVDYIRVYPNPATDELKIQLKENLHARYDFTLMDNLGRIVIKQPLYMSSGMISIPISTLSSGLYIVQITQDGKTVYRDKVIKD